MKIVSRFLRQAEGSGGHVSITVDGETVQARQGDSVAVALLLQDGNATRTTGRGNGRTPFCMMGVCFDCLVELDGQGNVQACMVPVRDGMVVRRQAGFRKSWTKREADD